ncbi:protein kinase/lanthionine synthetase C family protein [Chitinophaga filiformis]|uniref:protein kinase/lanthionine synthetase C family protein n=1 Tax=Chitinophaga filiformis TaxID=104663 RepID=UPI001F1B89F3|nr:protein kinase/lanthionine synthetase C family protein [Chitinophaga filiformis]MCF6402122.1 protein kinase/lanthionine synthetase C family protein [Chitinophaga filiformis]
MQEDKSITTIVNLEAEENVVEEAPKGKVEKKSGKRIGFNYIIYKSLKENRKNDVMKCIYIKGLFNFGTCVIKEGTLGDSTDKHGRDIKDRLVWQKELHEKLHGKVRVPRYLGSFEENGNYYLVIEHIKGESLVHAFRKHSKDLRDGLITRNRLGQKFLGYLLKIIDLLEVLHKHQVVHRDASSNNFMITPGGKIALIDLELSYSLDRQFPSPPFQLGTHGFMSPQQIATLTPTAEEDIFALGAIIFQMWTHISPGKIVDMYHTEFVKRINFFIPDQKIANIVALCMDPVVENRPTLDAIRKVIQEYKSTSQTKSQRGQSQPYQYSRQEILDAVQQSIATYSSPWLADPDKGWFADNGKEPAKDNEKISKSWFGSFNQGAAGVIYMLSTAKSVGINIDTTLPFIQKGLDLIQQKYIDKKISSSPGLHFGAAGIAATITNAIQSELLEFQPKYVDWIQKLLDKDNKGLDILNGISGQGLANIMCDPVITDKQLRERTHSYVQQLLSQQQEDGSWITSPKSKKKKVAKGFLIGISGIVYFLLEYTQVYNDKQALAAALRGLKWLSKSAKQNKESVYWPSNSGKKKHSSNTWWALGAAGIALSFIKAYALTQDAEHQKFATKILNAHKEKGVNNGLSQANGLSGLGEVYLEAYQTFNDPVWLQRADWIAQHIMHLQKIHLKNGPYWLTEHEKQPVASFATGNSGILHFLLRFCYPDRIGFPMSPFHHSEAAIQTPNLITQTQSV